MGKRFRDPWQPTTDTSGIRRVLERLKRHARKPEADLEALPVLSDTTTALELFSLGKPRRPLPGFVDAGTSWSKVAEDIREWITQELNRKPVRFPWYWFGPVGCGKSSAAACVFQAAPGEVRLPDGRTITATPVAWRLDELVEALKKCRRNGTCEVVEGTRSVQRSERVIFEMMRRASLVLLDEVGLSKKKPDTVERAIVDTIADQVQFCRAIITSNVQPKKRDPADTSAALQDVYDARIASRFLANGIARQFEGSRLRNKNLEIQWRKPK